MNIVICTLIYLPNLIIDSRVGIGETYEVNHTPATTVVNKTYM